MKKSVLMFSLLSGTALMFPRLTIASGLPALTHTYTPEPKPAFQFEQTDKAFKTAAVCFLGAGDCDSNVGFDKGDDYVRSGKEICMENGYEQTVCTVPSYLYNQCPEDSNYYQSCKEDRPRACKEAGFTETSCASGTVVEATCSFDANYKKCKCDPCSGYDYTYAQASAQGYVPDGSCLSCSETKYKRKENPCSGYSSCECGGETGSASCYSGSIQKFESCKKCCSACASGTSLNCASDCYREEKGKDSCGNLCYSCYKGRIHIYGYWGSTNYCYPNCTIPNYSYVRYATEYKYCEYKDGSKKLLNTEEMEGCFASLASNCNDDAVGGDWDEYSGFCN